MQTTLRIEGMHCASCPLLIEETLEDLPGVEEARASLAKNEAEVVYDPDSVALPKLIEAIQEIGYAASPKEVAR